MKVNYLFLFSFLELYLFVLFLASDRFTNHATTTNLNENEFFQMQNTCFPNFKRSTRCWPIERTKKPKKKNEKTYSKGDIAAVRSYGCFGYVQTMQTEAVGNDLRKLSEPNLCTYWRQQQRKIASVRNAPKLTSAKHSLIGLRFRCNFQSVFNR